MKKNEKDDIEKDFVQEFVQEIIGLI